MSTITAYKIDVHRRLCIKKDLYELNLWTTALEDFNTELDHLNMIEKQLIKNSSISIAIKAMRRNNILNMASICKYEQELKTEYEYGKTEYNDQRSKSHEQRQQSYLQFLDEIKTFKNQIYNLLKRYRSK
ncbi:hypothetical protein [Winogradskyella ursingii]|uniref:hypothetical protein n=1 Tax=Winogradskyella ursingii TaxID=2686079 RepID=UPI0015CB2135|nr:hypothetical protein [Winogradskyella ursingii]